VLRNESEIMRYVCANEVRGLRQTLFHNNCVVVKLSSIMRYLYESCRVSHLREEASKEMKRALVVIMEWLLRISIG
jgi:hypothetical protein